GIDTLEVDVTLKRALQPLRVVEARRLEGTVGVEPGGRIAQREKSSGAGKQGPVGAHLVEKPAREITLQPEVPERARRVEQRICGDLLPEAAQLGNALDRRVARNDGGVDGADGNTGDPIWMQVRLGERFIDPSLIGAERAAPLQQQSDALEGWPVGNSMRLAAPASTRLGLGGPVHSPHSVGRVAFKGLTGVHFVSRSSPFERLPCSTYPSTPIKVSVRHLMECASRSASPRDLAPVPEPVFLRRLVDVRFDPTQRPLAYSLVATCAPLLRPHRTCTHPRYASADREKCGGTLIMATAYPEARHHQGAP